MTVEELAAKVLDRIADPRVWYRGANGDSYRRCAYQHAWAIYDTAPSSAHGALPDELYALVKRVTGETLFAINDVRGRLAVCEVLAAIAAGCGKDDK
jgi:hypothetical protein